MKELEGFVGFTDVDGTDRSWLRRGRMGVEVVANGVDLYPYVNYGLMIDICYF